MKTDSPKETPKTIKETLTMFVNRYSSLYRVVYFNTNSNLWSCLKTEGDSKSVGDSKKFMILQRGTQQKIFPGCRLLEIENLPRKININIKIESNQFELIKTLIEKISSLENENLSHLIKAQYKICLQRLSVKNITHKEILLSEFPEERHIKIPVRKLRINDDPEKDEETTLCCFGF